MTKEYIITFPNFFPDRPFLFRKIHAVSSGAAKYHYWLDFRDAYPMTFGEFLKIVKCRRSNAA